MRGRRNAGGLPGAIWRRIPRPRCRDAAERHAAKLRACTARDGRRLGARSRGQGRGRRSRRDARRVDRCHGFARAGGKQRYLQRGAGRGHRDAGRASHSAGRTSDQSRAARNDPRGSARGGGAIWRGGGYRCRNLHSRRGEDRGADAERAAWGDRRPVDPRHHGNCRTLFLRRLDRHHPSRHRRRACRWTHTHRGRDRRGFRGGGCA